MSLQLTKDQRYTAYCIMLAEIEMTGYCASLCHLSGKLFDIFPSTTGNSGFDEFGKEYEIAVVTKDFYPELWNKRNTDSGMGYWWDTRETKPRINALKQCIEETADF